ncbi:MAG: hypothetical protein GIKADHBN_00610 [Phycisphaerales bacterium]|nr:hypothetical protein [Phycisphaerales bacterium]
MFSADTLDALRAAIAEARASGDEASVRACSGIEEAVAACDAGEREKAAAIFDRVLPGTSDLRLIFAGYQFAFRTGDQGTAEKLIQRRLELAGRDSADEARAWNNYGLLEHFRGNQQEAERMLRRALEIDERIGCLEGVARDLGNLALIPESQGDLDTAERLTRESLAVAERAGYKPVIARKLCNLGEIAMARGRPAEARELFIRARAAFEALGIEKYRLLCEQHLGELDRRETQGTE